MQFLPVVSATGERLMPCHAARARQLLRQGKAVKRHDRGLVYLQLTQHTTGATQEVVCGIDPGSKKEAFVVQSNKHTLLNIQADTVGWVSAAVQRRSKARRLRRNRKTPHRPRRANRLAGHKRGPPSTRARWGLKVRLVCWLARYYPLSAIVIEDIKARARPGKRHWNRSFSPLEVGKVWCYGELEKVAPVQKVPGYTTKMLREAAGLRKFSAKLSDRWDAHCVDAFVLANSMAKGTAGPTQTSVLLLVPLQFHRRQIHRFNTGKGARRVPYGGTRSLGLKRGSWVRHARYGVVYVGGTMNDRISLHSMETGGRLTRNARVQDCQVLCMAAWRIRFGLKPGKACGAPPDRASARSVPGFPRLKARHYGRTTRAG